MKGTEQFKKVIQAFLQKKVSEDELFAKTFAKPNKNIDDCVNFILNTVKESGCSGFDDAEVYSIAIHYYDEDELDTKYLKKMNCNVVVNHTPELTAEDMKEMEEQAKKDYYAECLRKQKELNKPKKKVNVNEVQGSLF